MSETTTTSNDATKLTARVIIELSASGQLMMEYYTNGQRTRTTLDRGNEWWQVVDQLHLQRKAITSAEERREAQAEEKSRKRHREVWLDAANKFGTRFAVAKIKGPVPMGYGQYLEPEDKVKTKPRATPGANIDELLDLL